jgi:hypothetical protein
MTTDRNRPEPFETLNYAITYLLAGMFLYAADLMGSPALATKVMGIMFMAFAFFVMIATFFRNKIS